MTLDFINVTKSQQKHISGLIEFVGKKLFPRMKDIEITVHRKNLDCAYGYCESYADDRSDRPRRFIIQVDRGLKLHLLLETISHEMVHVKQYARGELHQGLRCSRMRWQGKWVDHKIEYRNLPWEVEAYKKEKVLFREWLNSTNFINKSWINKEV